MGFDDALASNDAKRAQRLHTTVIALAIAGVIAVSYQVTYLSNAFAPQGVGARRLDGGDGGGGGGGGGAEVLPDGTLRDQSGGGDGDAPPLWKGFKPKSAWELTAHTGDEKVTTFTNMHDDVVDVIYVPADGSEEARRVITDGLWPRQQVTINTFVGHRFVFVPREGLADSSESEVLKEVVIEPMRTHYVLEGPSIVVPDAATGRAPQPDHNLGKPVKFRNLGLHSCLIYYDPGNGQEGVYNGEIRANATMSTTSYAGHKFYLLNKRTKQRVADFIVDPNPDAMQMYLYAPCQLKGSRKAPCDAQGLEHTHREQQFMRDYFARIGRHWIGHWPRTPPSHFMWLANKVGERHHVDTAHGANPACLTTKHSYCPPLNARLELETLSTVAKVFKVANFLSEKECDHIVERAKRTIKRSTTSGFVSNTRTSSNTWARRESSPAMDTVFRRIADVLRIDGDIMHHSAGGVAENMQVVHYGVGQEYRPHFDWWVGDTPHSRFATVLMYLNEQKHDKAGGETTFPHLGPMDVHGGKGTAVIFYSLLEDGNADVMSLHGALPVHDGEKWLSNVWVWDPHQTSQNMY